MGDFSAWQPKIEQREAQARAVGILAAPSDAFRKVSKPADIQFPDAWKSHPDFRQEWWYVTANVKDTEGNDYGVQWTLFRFGVSPGDASGWENSQVYMAHVVVTTKDQQWSAERFARGGIGQAGVSGSPFSAWLDNWRWDSIKDDAFPAILTAADDKFSFRLTMRSTGKPVLQGEDGFSRKHHALPVASYYYSVPGLMLSGKLTLDGKSFDVAGHGWVDREWSSESLSRSQSGWDWMSLQLSDGRKLMVSQVRETGSKDAYKFGSLTSVRGETTILSSKDIDMQPSQLVTLKNGRVVPSGWDITITQENLTLNVTPLNMESWLNFSFPYWEGPVEVTGDNIRGAGFLEMTGY